jgi:hypothetical protein
MACRAFTDDWPGLPRQRSVLATVGHQGRFQATAVDPDSWPAIDIASNT